jgi:hypothetical protein
MIGSFYSTPEYEKRLKDTYDFAIKKKQDEIDEIQRRTKKIQKFTAKAHISRPERVFTVFNNKIYCGKIEDNIICPNRLIEGGCEYKLDTEGDYAIKINDFMEKYNNYKVIFNPDGRYGPTAYYCTKNDATPARLIPLDYIGNDFILILDDENKYDILCG